MSRFDNLFDISPPENHQRKIEVAVAPLLAEYRAQSRKQFLIFFGALSASFALSAVFVLRFFKEEQKEDVSQDLALNILDMSDEDLTLVNNMDTFADLSEQDFELLMKMALEEES